MADTEDHVDKCFPSTLGIQLFVLPPRSPKLNGCVERANRTHTEEFWECYDGDFDRAAGAAGLGERYNIYRPHQALRYQTPLAVVQRWHATRKE